MKRMTLKTYAVTHKMSLFEVIKAVRNGRLPSQTVEENGKEVMYVLVDEGSEGSFKTSQSKAQNAVSDASLQEQIKALRSEVKLLRREIEQIKRQLGGGILL